MFFFMNLVIHCPVAELCPTLCGPMYCSTPGFPVLPVSWSLLKLMSTESVMPSNHLILCHHLHFLPSVFPGSWFLPMSQLFPSGGQVLELKHQHILAVHSKTLKSLLQHHSLKTSILWHSALFMVQLSHPYMTTRKTIALTIWTFVGKVMSLLFNMLSRFDTAFLPRNKHLLILWL